MLPFTYILFISTFLVYPAIAGFITYRFDKANINRWVKVVIPYFLFCDAAYYFGYSFCGDYPDYIFFSLQFITICLLVFSSKPTQSIPIKILKIIGQIIIAFGVITGIIGILFFLVVVQDYEYDKKIHFTNATGTYELRRYTFDFATFEHAKYTYDTYKNLGNLPFEKKVDETVLFDTATDGPFSIVDSINARHYLILQLDSNDRYIKEIK